MSTGSLAGKPMQRAARSAQGGEDRGESGGKEALAVR